ncbi:MAG: hypothetical protein QOE93_2472, partial [Actinomycetota bacterium]|nr:hypothetical protein [Actinomycetota bacterium]
MSILPAPEKCFEPYRIPSGDQTRTYDWMDGARIVYATWYDGGRLTDFALMLQMEPVDEAGEWLEARRIDC